MTELEKVEREIVKFMRGKYLLDEVAEMFCGTPWLKFRQGRRTIVSINLQDDHYDIRIVFGKAEREKFEAVRHEFPPEIHELYDGTRTYHDGKRLLINVDNLYTFEAVKKLILIKKKPNRKPLSKENAVFGKCGHRCDICVHYTGISEEFRNILIPHMNAVYGDLGWSPCTGCDASGCYCHIKDDELYEPIKCLQQNRLEHCFDCKNYPCEQSTIGYRQLEHKSISADDVTYAVLPYVPHQYEEQ